MTGGPHIDDVTVDVHTFPLPEPEADGTLQWDAVTAVAVQLRAGDQTGLGWTYSSPAAADVIHHHLASVVRGRDCFDVPGGWSAMRRACRNLGAQGLVMQALSAVDIAWWDLKARVLDVPLAALFGRCRTTVPIYGSGGFTTLTDGQLREQIDWWHEAGCSAMKIKIGESWGSRIDRDLVRIQRLCELAGADVRPMVDANGGYTVGQARRVGAVLDAFGVRWFEEPVSSQDTRDLALLRAELQCDIAAGEYVADLRDAAALVPVVDCLQLDATRCGGYTGWLRGAALAEAANLEVSAHCAPALHAPVAAAVPNLRHLEWFVDHVRIESQLVDGAPRAADGVLHLTDAPGHGMVLAA